MMVHRHKVLITVLITILFLVKTRQAGAVEVIEGSSYQKSQSLLKAIELLKSTPSGREIYERALDAKVPIREGKISKTEITATRTTDGQNEKLDFVIQVLVSQDKDPVFQALDLAHELVHAVNPKKNPFDPNMNATEYVQHGIEGAGGEAAAIAEECNVGREMIDENANLKAETAALVKARCKQVWKMENDSDKWRKSFYQLGQYYRGFVNQLMATSPDRGDVRDWANRIEAKSPLFSSAVAHKPYPVALLEEYLEVTKVICDRAMKSSVGRGIASFAHFEERCKAIKR